MNCFLDNINSSNVLPVWKGMLTFLEMRVIPNKCWECRAFYFTSLHLLMKYLSYFIYYLKSVIKSCRQVRKSFSRRIFIISSKFKSKQANALYSILLSLLLCSHNFSLLTARRAIVFHLEINKLLSCLSAPKCKPEDGWIFHA